jgi:hypothetical protein
MSWSYLYFFFLHFIVLMTSWVDRNYISFHISLFSWLHELIVFIFPFYISSFSWLHELIVIIFPFIFHYDFMSWSYLYFVFTFHCPHDFMSWSYLYFLFTFHCPQDFHELINFTLVVLMIYFNPSSLYLVVLVI